MKSKTLYIILAVFALCAAAFGAVQEAAIGVFSSVMAFPFEQIAAGLRALSLSGSGGNAAAIVIYVLVCLLPTAAVLICKRGKLRGEDLLILVLSAVMFAAVYYMINPGLLMGNLVAEAAGVVKAILGGICWSVVVSWIVLKLLHRSENADRVGVQRYLRICLVIMAFFFTALAFGGGVSGAVAAFEKLHEGNTGDMVPLGTSHIFIVLQAVVAAVPYALDALVAVKGAELLGAMSADRYSAESVDCSAKLACFAVMSLKLTVILSLMFNLLQLVFFKQLLVIDVTVALPLGSIAFMLAVVLLSRLISENKSLKDDNDLFI